MSRFLPLVLFIALAVLLGIGLTLDPKKVPSALIDKPAPAFTLPLLHASNQTFSPEDFKGRVWMLNVWATWCVSCRAEHEVLNQIAQLGLVDIVGLNYKDETEPARAWLGTLGNPYKINVEDKEGRVAIDWGVYGTPETFLVDAKGIIRYKQIGPVTVDAWLKELQPRVLKYKAEASASRQSQSANLAEGRV